MPKEGLSKEEWRIRLKLYAKGKKFGPGECPGKSNVFVREAITAIDSCKAGLNGLVQTSLDKFFTPGPSTKKYPCTCGYHEKQERYRPAPNLSHARPHRDPDGTDMPGTSRGTSGTVSSEPVLTNEAVEIPAIALPSSSTSISGPVRTVETAAANKSNLEAPITPRKKRYPAQDPANLACGISLPPEKQRRTGRLLQVDNVVETGGLARATTSQDTGYASQETSASLPGPSTQSSGISGPTEDLIASIDSSIADCEPEDVTLVMSARSILTTTDLSQQPAASVASIEEVATVELHKKIPPSPKRQPPSHIPYLPKDMRNDAKIPAHDLEFIARTLYAKAETLREDLQLWNYPPPPPAPNAQGVPKPDPYFGRRLFVWAPVRTWKYSLRCPKPECYRILSKKGFHRRIRTVVDMRDCYYMVTELVNCSSCSASYLTSSPGILQQLREADQLQFRVLLTKNYACDISVVTLLRSRTLGNSSNALWNSIKEIHSEEWLKKLCCYLTACDRHRKRRMFGEEPIDYDEPLSFVDLPCARWFTACYVKDVYNRIEHLRAAATSKFGKILKIDSTKAITGKLQGEAKGTAMWCTNVGNENGEILISVFTNSESVGALQAMADGLMARYEDAQEPPPRVLYTDRDCCRKSGQPSRYKQLFGKWIDMEVKLDVFHFMRRLGVGCTTESHPLFPTFMSQLSACILEWDSEDLRRLRDAKKVALRTSGARNITEEDVTKAITKQELVTHCKRKTRGVEATIASIDALLDSLKSATDSLGVPLFNESIMDIWALERTHVSCLQDVEDLPLYTITGYIKKGGAQLPAYRCGRGSNSLENFHLHLCRFVPGTTTSATHMQAYLLDGIVRWNAHRSAAAISSDENLPPQNRIPERDISNNPLLRTFDLKLQERVESLSKSIFNKSVFPNYRPPRKVGNNRELIGMEYLDNQSQVGLPSEEELAAATLESLDDKVEGEGGLQLIIPHIEELGNDEFGFLSIEEDKEDKEVPVGPSKAGEGAESDESSSESEREADEEGDEEVPRPAEDLLSGWEKVDKLAGELVQLTGRTITVQQAMSIGQIYQTLEDHDKRRIVFRPYYPTKPALTNYGRHGLGAHVGAQAVKRAFTSAAERPRCPSGSRIVEAVCFRLMAQYRSDISTPVYRSRYAQVVQRYNEIRGCVRLNQAVLANSQCSFSLFCINESVVQKWYKAWERKQQPRELLLEQQVNIPVVPLSGTPQLPARDLPSVAPMPAYEPLVTNEPVDRIVCLQPAMPEPVAGPSNSRELPSAEGTSALPPAGPKSRSTEYRNAYLARKGIPVGPPRNPKRCPVCKNVRNEDKSHRQIRGKWYCPQDSTFTSYEDFRAKRVAELAEKQLRERAEASDTDPPAESTTSATDQGSQQQQESQ